MSCISPVEENRFFTVGTVNDPTENKLYAIEPSYDEIPKTVLRRMAKAVRLAVGAAMPLIKDQKSLDGIIIGTANGGMEESVKFMNQLIEFNEGMLTPGNFVQSTPNGLSSQIAMIEKNRQYNITHTHRGLSFENALLDADDLLKEHPKNNYLLGGADEISLYNFNIDKLAGWYRSKETPSLSLYDPYLAGSIAGEGAALFTVTGEREGAVAQMFAASTVHSEDKEDVKKWFDAFITEHNIAAPDLLLTGDSGDSRFLHFYDMAEQLISEQSGILRFKHLTGEFSTASALGFYLACRIIKEQKVPEAMIKRRDKNGRMDSILIYNNYHGRQHGVVFLKRPV